MKHERHSFKYTMYCCSSRVIQAELITRLNWSHCFPQKVSFAEENDIVAQWGQNCRLCCVKTRWVTMTLIREQHKALQLCKTCGFAHEHNISTKQRKTIEKKRTKKKNKFWPYCTGFFHLLINCLFMKRHLFKIYWC